MTHPGTRVWRGASAPPAATSAHVCATRDAAALAAATGTRHVHSLVISISRARCCTHTSRSSSRLSYSCSHSSPAAPGHADVLSPAATPPPRVSQCLAVSSSATTAPSGREKRSFSLSFSFSFSRLVGPQSGRVNPCGSSAPAPRRIPGHAATAAPSVSERGVLGEPEQRLQERHSKLRVGEHVQVVGRDRSRRLREADHVLADAVAGSAGGAARAAAAPRRASGTPTRTQSRPSPRPRRRPAAPPRPQRRRRSPCRHARSAPCSARRSPRRRAAGARRAAAPRTPARETPPRSKSGRTRPTGPSGTEAPEAPTPRTSRRLPEPRRPRRRVLSRLRRRRSRRSA